MKDLKIFFFIKKGKKNADGLTAIYGKITYLDSSTTYSTGLAIKPADWIKTKQLAKPKTQQEEDLQKEKDKQKTTIKKIKDLLEIKEEKITANRIKDILLARETTKDIIVPKITLKTVMKELIAEKISLVNKKRRSEGTLTKYYTTEKHLDNFLATRNQKDVTLDELNFKFITDFYHYLINDKVVNEKKEEGICNNTAQKYIQTLRCSVFYAIKMDYLLRDPFKRYEYEWDDVETVYLTKSELEQIENYQFNSKGLQIIADIYLFGCYTGFAPVDLKQISWDSIELRDNGKYWFNVSRQKTGIKCEVMMFQKTLALIEKYKDDLICKAENKLIPYRANQTMNEGLKMIATLVGITKNLSHYSSRHTFGSTIMLGNGASMEVTKRALGHVRITQTEHYAKIIDAKVTSEMERVDENMKSGKGNFEEMARQKSDEKLKIQNEDLKIIPLKLVSEKTVKIDAESTEDKNMLYTRRKLANKKMD